MDAANYSDIAYFNDYSDTANYSNETYDYYVDSPYFAGASSKEHIIVGLSIAVFVVPGLFAYLIIVIVILRNPQTFAKNSFYTLLLNLAICEILETINCLCYAVPCILFQKRIFGDSFDVYFNPIGCGLLYYVGLVSMILIAINRYIAVCKFYIYQRVFHASRTRLYLLGAWIFAIFSTVWQYLPGFGYLFYPHWYIWGFDTEAWANYYFAWYDRVVSAVLFLILIFCYAAIIIKRPRKTSAVLASTVDEAAKDKRERSERVLALQLCLISSLFLIYNVLNKVDILNRFYFLFVTLFYMFFVNCNPFIYFAFNREIREHVLKMMGKTKTAIGVIVSESGQPI